MGQFYREVMRFINHMDMQDWAVALVGVVIVGFVCLRGFGSRSNY
ncbi:MAG: hypothetical protein ABIP48_15205 [Planctomycetota bacterium]